MIYDLIVIGSGPAGYVAAIRAGQTGLKSLVIDKKYIGGMCLNWGCIPTKSLMEAGKRMRLVREAADFGVQGIDPEKLEFDWQQALKRNNQVVSRLSRGIEYLWKKHNVDFLKAEAKILSATQVQADHNIYEAKNILIATGSRIIPQKVFDASVEVEEIFSLPCTAQQPLLYGRGPHLVELAQFFRLIGKNPVILADALPLIPSLDSHLESFLLRKLKKDGIPVIPLENAKIKGGSLFYEDKEYIYDVVINAGFREAVLPAMDFELELERGFIRTNDSFETSVKGIYAAGDVTGKSFLAHLASAHALEVISAIHGEMPSKEPRLYPINIYTDPEIAQIGATEDQLKASGQEYLVKQQPLSANSKAIIAGETDGFIRLIYEPRYQEVLGVQIVAANATDLISEAGILMELEGTIFDLARTIHAHPTVSEIYSF